MENPLLISVGNIQEIADKEKREQFARALWHSLNWGTNPEKVAQESNLPLKSLKENQIVCDKKRALHFCKSQGLKTNWHHISKVLGKDYKKFFKSNPSKVGRAFVYTYSEISFLMELGPIALPKSLSKLLPKEFAHDPREPIPPRPPRPPKPPESENPKKD